MRLAKAFQHVDASGRGHREKKKLGKVKAALPRMARNISCKKPD